MRKLLTRYMRNVLCVLSGAGYRIQDTRCRSEANIPVVLRIGTGNWVLGMGVQS